jgi:peptidoglycan hydrolase-like protein with peptidoglycan-binding domain
VQKIIVSIVALSAMTWLSLAAPAAGTHKKAKAASSKSRSTKSRSKSRAKPVRRSYQQAPTPDRYKEIQQALADKGYFKGTVDGKWGSDSIDALKKFQTEQSLEPDGKIGSLSLIALGLGPKRLSAQSTPQTGNAK